MKNTPAYVKAMALLAISDMSERKLREKLAAKGFSKEEIYEAVEKLESEGYLSDDRLIENLVNYYSKKKFYGKYRIKLELLSKFDRESVDRAFDSACEVIDFRAFAAEFAQKEIKKGTDREKLIRKLQRLGHDTPSIRGALSLISQSDE
ncbi:MAG: regulatory protein RecX [Oscillospiraceae bacterium]|jgi:regulatory protein|nr:regulatory protein RecX [Oscillospiraceae bacterium]